MALREGGMPQVRGVLLDVDGTLVDSNEAHARSWVDALAEHGYRVSLDEIRRAIGMGGDNLLPAVVGLEKDSPQGEAISHRRDELFEQHYLPTVEGFPSVRALVERMQRDGLKLIVASSASREQVEPLLSIAGVDDLLTEQVSSSEAENSKPDPDVIHVGLDKLGLAPHEAVMLGDTPYDVSAAAKAGVATIALRSGGWSDEDLKGAVAVYADPADLLAHYDASPLVEAELRARS